MADVKTVPYEIVLRFNCEPGEEIGHLRGCHRVMATYLVDEKNSIVGKVTGADAPAADFPPEELVKYLGEQFTDFSTQLEKTKENHNKLQEEKSQTEAKLSDATQMNEALQANNKRLGETLSTISGALTKLQSPSA